MLLLCLNPELFISHVQQHMYKINFISNAGLVILANSEALASYESCLSQESVSSTSPFRTLSKHRTFKTRAGDLVDTVVMVEI